MFKALTNSVILFFLVITNMTLFIWCVNQLELGASPAKRTLFVEVQAKASISAQKSVQRIEAVTQRPILNHSTRTPYAIQQDKPSQQIVLQFKSEHIRLDKTEQVKLENSLQSWDIKTFHSAKIFSGATLSKKNGQLPQLAKLRVQSVARMIYPYTQTVKMYYHSSIEKDKVVVKIFSPQK